MGFKFSGRWCRHCEGTYVGFLGGGAVIVRALM